MPTSNEIPPRPARVTISPERQARRERLEAQLRANLVRRKEGTRAKTSSAGPEPEPER